jgi:hypothetical protein
VQGAVTGLLGGTLRARERYCRRAGGLLPEEAYAFLVGAPVFKTGEGEDLVLAGSIPVRLR